MKVSRYILALFCLSLWLPTGRTQTPTTRTLSQMEKGHLPPELQGPYLEWKTKPIHLPPEALDAKPYREETRAAATSFRRVWSTHRQAALDAADVAGPALAQSGQNPPTSPAPDWAGIDAQVSVLEPLLASFENLVLQSDYELTAGNSDLIHEEGYANVPAPADYVAIQTCEKLWCWKAFMLTRQGKFPAADRAAGLVFRAGQTNPFDGMIPSAVRIAFEHLATTVWEMMIDRCDDPALLQKMLGDQNALAAHPFEFPPGIQGRTLEQIGQIRDLLRRGIAAHAQDLTGLQLEARSLEMEAEYSRSRILPSVRGDAELVKSAEDLIQMDQEMSEMLEGKPLSGGSLAEKIIASGGRDGYFAMLYAANYPDADELRTRAAVQATRMDLLRLATARKLYRLQQGRVASDRQSLVPRYLPVLPADRFADGNAYPWMNSRDYSVGPDRRDDSAAIKYDPTNGTTSSGDVFLNLR